MPFERCHFIGLSVRGVKRKDAVQNALNLFVALCTVNGPHNVGDPHNAGLGK